MIPRIMAYLLFQYKYFVQAYMRFSLHDKIYLMQYSMHNGHAHVYGSTFECVSLVPDQKLQEWAGLKKAML